jgi:DNA-binding GntR family transcriptional regulator
MDQVCLDSLGACPSGSTTSPYGCAVALPPDDPRPPYLQIADALRAAIQDGEFAPGSQIPSTNDLTMRYGVARNTVRSAVGKLVDEGLLVPRHGSGVFVRSSLPEPLHTGSDSSRIGAVVQELGDVREEIRDLRRRVVELESRVDREEVREG